MEAEQLFKSGQTILIDKPEGWTSFDVVNKLRTILKYKFGIPKIKVGHAGTLDPLATGLLIICIGKHTKRIEDYQNLYKEYVGQICIGATRPSYDRETEIDQTYDIDHVNGGLIQAAFDQFTGQFYQFPPIFSAIKQEGKPIYKKARRGEHVEVKPRLVEISSLTWNRLDDHIISFEVKCSKGTYIRSLAHDVGKALDCGGYLHQLRRTAIGPHSVAEATTMENLEPTLQSIVADDC